MQFIDKYIMDSTHFLLAIILRLCIILVMDIIKKIQAFISVHRFWAGFVVGLLAGALLFSLIGCHSLVDDRQYQGVGVVDSYNDNF